MPDAKSFKTGAIVCDDRYGPLLVTTFIGVIDLEAARWFEEVHTRAILRQVALGRRVVSVNDSTQTGSPTPELRKFWSEMAERTSPTVLTAMLGTFVVLDSALMRGALTAISWLSPVLRDIESFATLPLALKAGTERLAAAGTPVPLSPTLYARPQLPAEQLAPPQRR
jgi:hypothetical protein